ncbi:unnamed protein product [Paramecium sonneborni]|uniref:Transmembrane protein n=1 Tax=Paramecium sonneborni TaxID=65129 RepID=A0A8S1MHH1_9CILI|nr:unnamed protein product [Paramecium sonneborni]
MSTILPINYLDNFQKPAYILYQIIYSYLREESKQLLKARLRKNFSKQYDQTTLIFEEFYKTEYIIRILNLQMVKLLEDKCVFYDCLIKDQVSQNKIFDICFKISVKLCKIEKNINQIYQKNPSISILNLKVFYQTEILRNYAQASREHSVNYELESQYKQTSIVLLAKQNKVAFLITKLGDCSYNVKIERASSNAKQFFQNELPLYIEPLIPLGIRDYHGQNLHDFFQTGQSPRYKQNARLFILQKNFIQIAESYLDSYNSLSELRFINIILELKDVKGYMILNNQFQIVGINKHLLDLLNFSKSQIDYFQPDDMIYGLNIQILIPQFKMLIEENKQVSLIEFYFIKQCYMFDLTKHTMTERFTNTNLLDRFESQIEIQSKYHNNKLAYIILTFDYLKKQNATSMLSNFIECSTKSNQKIDIQQKLQEGIKIDSPYDFDDSKYLDVQLFQPELTYQQLNSPQEKSSTYELLFQQKFYNRYHDISRGSDDVSIIKKNFLKQVSMPQFYSEFQKQKISVEDVCTPQKKKEKYDSNFQDKVEFIDKMGQKKIKNIFVRLAIIFLVVSSLLGIVSLLLQTFLIQNNFNNYINDVGQLSIKNDILQPMLSFFILRFIIYDKTNLLIQNQITKEQYFIETDFAQKYLKKEFAHFHDHIQELFESQLLQDFLIDHYYQVIYLEDDYSYTYENFSARTFFIKYLDYQQFIYAIYSNNELPKITTPVTFQMLNQKLMFEICSYLSDQVYNSTINRNSKQINDQIIVIACFLSVNFICLLLSNYYYRKFANQRQLFGSLMFNIEKSVLESELENLDFLIGQIQNYNITQFYTFNEKNKEFEIQVLSQKSKTHFSSNQKQIHKKAKIDTSRFLIFIYTMFVGFLTVNLTNTLILSEFIQKYKPTATMHKNTSDLCLNVALIYSQKEKLNNQVFFQYLKESDFTTMIQQLNQSSIQIQQYQQELLNINLANLLFRSDFVTYFLNQETQDLCTLINPENNQKNGQICISSFEGSFALGIQAVLNHILKIVRQELMGQDFSQRQPINILEVEGAYLFVEYLQTAADMAMKDFSEQVLHYKNILETILVSSISFTLILLAIILIAYKTNLKLKLTYAVKFIHLIPREVLFLDNSFERKVRMAILKDPNL